MPKCDSLNYQFDCQEPVASLRSAVKHISNAGNSRSEQATHDQNKTGHQNSAQTQSTNMVNSFSQTLKTLILKACQSGTATSWVLTANHFIKQR